MTYDPDRTHVLPPIEPSFPITDELPAVHDGGGSGRPVLAMLAVLLVAGIAAIAAILIIDSRRVDDATIDDVSVATAVADNPPDGPPSPTVAELDDAEPGYWRVVDVVDGLNVRSGPGTNNAVVGSLLADARHVFATGQRATVNGAEWRQVELPGTAELGWVSARFLAIDSPPDESAPTPAPTVDPTATIVCFEGSDATSRVARLEFANSLIRGVVRSVDPDGAVTVERVDGVLEEGTGDVTLTDAATERVRRRTWIFRPADVDLGDGRSMSVVDCSLIADQLQIGANN